MKVPIKIKLLRKGGDIVEYHRFSVDSEESKFSELSSIVNHLWGERPKRLQLTYTDDEGDLVSFASEEEWKECLEVHELTATAGTVLRLTAQRSKKERDLDSPTNEHASFRPTSFAQVIRQSSSVASSSFASEAPTEVNTKVVPAATFAADVEEVLSESVEKEVEESAVLIERQEESVDSLPSDMTLVNLPEDPVEVPAVTSIQEETAQEEKKEEPQPEEVKEDNAPVVDIQEESPAPAVPSDIEKKVQALEAELNSQRAPVKQRFLRACIASLRGNTDEAIKQLALAKRKGYNDLATLQTDPNLENARYHPLWEEQICPAKAYSIPHPTSNGNVKSVRQEVLTLLSIFPHLSLESANAALVASNGSLEEAVQSFVR